MKKLITLCCAVMMAAGMFAADNQPADPSTQLPPRKETLDALIRVNNYYMQKHPDPMLSIPYWSRKKVYEANLWTRAIYFDGLMALHSIYPDKKYWQYATDWADGFNWGMRRDETFTRNADNYACSKTYIDLYRLTPKPEMLTQTKALCNMLANTPQVDDWTWIDAIKMGLPVLTGMTVVTGDQKYADKAYEMYAWTRNELAGGLYNKKEGLWWRDKDFVPPYKEPNGANCYWSRGNGWVVAALVQALEDTPKDSKYYKLYADDLKEMCAALVKCQRADGFWNTSLLDESNFGGKEVTGSALFIYGMAYGVRKGLLDSKTYMPVIAKGWNAIMKDAIHPNGYLGYVQGTGKQPKDGQPVEYDSKPDFDDYGTGCVLLAGSEVYKL